MSNLYKLNQADFLKGAVSAVVAGVVWTIAGTFNQAGFDVFSTDWGMIISSAINAGVAAFVGYLGKQFMTDNEGKVMGVNLS